MSPFLENYFDLAFLGIGASIFVLAYTFISYLIFRGICFNDYHIHMICFVTVQFGLYTASLCMAFSALNFPVMNTILTHFFFTLHILNYSLLLTHFFDMLESCGSYSNHFKLAFAWPLHGLFGHFKLSYPSVSFVYICVHFQSKSISTT